MVINYLLLTVTISLLVKALEQLTTVNDYRCLQDSKKKITPSPISRVRCVESSVKVSAASLFIGLSTAMAQTQAAPRARKLRSILMALIGSALALGRENALYKVISPTNLSSLFEEMNNFQQSDRECLIMACCETKCFQCLVS